MQIAIFICPNADHTFLYHSLKKENFQITRAFSVKAFIYGFSSEVRRRHSFGKPVDDQLLGQVLTEILFFRAFEPQLAEPTEHDNQKIAELARRLVSAFSFDEIKSILIRPIRS